jgi:hypothetical protein
MYFAKRKLLAKFSRRAQVNASPGLFYFLGGDITMSSFEEKLQTLWDKEAENLSTERVQIPSLEHLDESELAGESHPIFNGLLMPDFEPNVLIPNHYRKNGQVEVVVEGLGNCFTGRYFNPLLQLVKDGKVKLWLVDLFEELQVAGRLM